MELAKQPEADALVADRGFIAVGYRLVVTSEADATIVREAIAGLNGVEVVVEPNRREVVAAWDQFRRRLIGWRSETFTELTPLQRFRWVPPVDSPSWAVLELADDELDRDADWLVVGLDLSVVCRTRQPVELPDETSGPGWKLIANSSSAHNLITDPGQVDWLGGAAVNFDNEFVILVFVSGRLAEGLTTFDGLDFTTDSTGDTNPRLIAIDRSLVGTDGFVVRINREVSGVSASVDGEIVSDEPVYDQHSRFVRGRLLNPPEPHSATLVAGVDIVTRPGGGVWRIDLGGALYATEGAPYFGSMGGIVIDQSMVAIASTLSGQGYWMVGAPG